MLVELYFAKVNVCFHYGDLRLVVILVFVYSFQSFLMHSLEFLLIFCEDLQFILKFDSFINNLKTHVRNKNSINGFVITHPDLHNAVVGNLLDPWPFPKYSVTPSWRSTFFAETDILNI